MDRELLIKLGMALHYADVLAGNIVTPFDELSGAGREAYFVDAKALLEAAPAAGVEIGLKEVEA